MNLIIHTTDNQIKDLLRAKVTNIVIKFLRMMSILSLFHIDYAELVLKQKTKREF